MDKNRYENKDFNRNQNQVNQQGQNQKSQNQQAQNQERNQQNQNRDKERPANPPYEKGRESNSGQGQNAGQREDRNRQDSQTQQNLNAGQNKQDYWDQNQGGRTQTADENETERNEQRPSTSGQNPNIREGNVQQKQEKKEKTNTAQQPSIEDWEGGGSRPENADTHKNKKDKKAA